MKAKTFDKSFVENYTFANLIANLSQMDGDEDQLLASRQGSNGKQKADHTGKQVRRRLGREVGRQVSK